MSRVDREDAARFLDLAKRSCGIKLGPSETLYLYFSATKGAGACECFLKRSVGGVTMVDPQRDLFDTIYSDWLERQRKRDSVWTWGWAAFPGRVDSLPELHLFDDPLSDSELIGPSHSLKWRHERFGDVNITYPQAYW